MATFSPPSVYGDTARHRLGDVALGSFIDAAYAHGLPIEAIRRRQFDTWDVQIAGKKVNSGFRSAVGRGNKWPHPTFRCDTQKAKGCDLVVVHNIDATCVVWIPTSWVLAKERLASSEDDPDRVFQVNDQYEIPVAEMGRGWDSLVKWLVDEPPPPPRPMQGALW